MFHKSQFLYNSNYNVIIQKYFAIVKDNTFSMFHNIWTS